MREIGADKYRSNVRTLRSIGMETGPMDDAAQNIVCAKRTGVKYSIGEERPTVNARNKENGKRIPNIIAGGRR